MSISNISSYLVTKIKGLSGVKANSVFDYENSTWDGYPAISVTLKQWDAKYITNAQNERTYIFTIRIYQEIAKNNMGPNQAESNLRTLADTINAAFDTDNRLNFNDVYTKPIGGRTGYLQDSPVRYFEIDVECHDVVNATG